MLSNSSTPKPGPFTSSCQILTGGQDYFDRYIRIIDESRKVLHLQVYIFNDDATGVLVQDALIRASRRGVRVFLVLDGIGSGHLPKIFLNRFSKAGIEVRFFSKVRFNLPLRMGRRLHHKLLVADHQKAIVGGINIADRYRGAQNQLPWLDYAVYLEGAASVHLHNLAVKILKKRNFRKRWLKRLWKSKQSPPPTRVRILENDFFKNNLQIRRSYYQAIKKSKKSVILFASYFLPSIKLLHLIEKTAARGVEVSLLLPQETDVLFYSTAVKYLYGRLLKKGIKIYEYPLSVLHAKVAVVDGQWCTIGSYNLNDLSDLLSIELNIEIFDAAITGAFQQQLVSILQNDCNEVLKATYLQVSWFYRCLWKTYYFGVLYSLKFMYWLTDKTKDYQIE